VVRGDQERAGLVEQRRLALVDAALLELVQSAVELGQLGSAASTPFLGWVEIASVELAGYTAVRPPSTATTAPLM
jgi:hypothetical protein